MNLKKENILIVDDNYDMLALLQRHLKIGFNRSARIVESMEKAGIVSNIGSNGQRELLVPNRNNN